jgi:hypothetical protein
MKPLAKTVATMEPIVAGYVVTRWKIAGAFCSRGHDHHGVGMGRVAVRGEDCRVGVVVVRREVRSATKI